MLAQLPKINWSEETKVLGLYDVAPELAYRNGTDVTMVKLTDGGVQPGKRVVAYKWNMSGKSGKESKIKLKDAGYKLHYQFAIQTDSRMWAVCGVTDMNRKTEHICVQEMDPNTLEKKGAGIHLGEVQASGIISWQPPSYRYAHSVSPNGNYILVYALGFSRLKFGVFDKEMRLQWKGERTYEENVSPNGGNRLQVDNVGNVHIICREGDRKVAYTEAGNPNWKYIFQTYYSDGRDDFISPITSNEKHLTDIVLATTPSLVVQLAGTYSDVGHFGRVSGVYSMSIDPKSLKQGKIKFVSLPEGFIIHYWNKAHTEKMLKKVKIGDFHIPDQFFFSPLRRFSDGSILLIGQSQRYYYKSSNSSAGVQTFTFPRALQLIAINISSDGTIKWKKSYEHDLLYHDAGEGGSYSVMQKDDKIFLFRYEKEKSSGKIQELDIDGSEQEYQLPVSSSNSGFAIYPPSCKQLNANEMLLVYDKRKVKKYAIVRF